MQTKVLVFTSQTDIPETYLYCGIKKAGFDIKVFLNETDPRISVLDKAEVEYEFIKFNSRLSPSTIRRMRREMQSFQPDIVHYFNSRALSNGLIASLGLPVKQIAYRGTIGHLSKWDPSSWLTYLNPKLDKTITVSHAVARYLEEIGIPRSKITPIHKGHSADWYTKPPVDLTRFGVPSGAFVICCVANVRPVKGVNYLIEAFQLLNKELPIHLLLIGEVRDKKVKELLSTFKSDQRLHAVGFQKDVSGFIAASDVSVMCSVEREGLSKAVIEAMYRKVPSVVTTVGGLPEVIEHEKSGLLVPPRDSTALAKAFERLFHDKDLRKRLSEGAFKQANTKFSIKQTIEKTIQVYQELTFQEG
jgi:glycosyltransferase involved in cell wall biosynthesis